MAEITASLVKQLRERTGAAADKAREDETPLEDITEEYSQYVDPKYLEQTMQESLMMGVEETPTAGRKGPASETGAEPAAAEATNQN